MVSVSITLFALASRMRSVWPELTPLSTMDLPAFTVFPVLDSMVLPAHAR